MTYVENEKQPQEEVIQKSKSEALIKKESPEPPPRLSISQPKSAKKKKMKAQAKQVKQQKHQYIIDGEQVTEMLPKDKKDRQQMATPQIRTEDWCSERLKDFTSPMAKDSGMLNSERLRRLSRVTAMSSSSMLHRSLSRRGSEAVRIGSGAQKRKQFIREKVSDSSCFQANANVIKMNVSTSEYVCGSGIPPESSYLNITSKQFYDNGIKRAS
jgi:hypothetical protein